MTLLLERPTLFERVRQDRTLIPKAIDKAIRFEPVATFKVRQTAQDLELAVNAILDLMPDLRLDPDMPAPLITGDQLRGPKHMHVP